MHPRPQETFTWMLSPLNLIGKYVVFISLIYLTGEIWYTVMKCEKKKKNDLLNS